MRALLLCGLLMTLPLTAAPVRGSLPTGPKVRVLLEKDANSALLEVKGGYRVVRKDTGSTLSSGKNGKRYVVHALQNGLRWGEEYPDVFQVSIEPTSQNTMVYVDGLQYKGSLSVYHVRDNRITIVNEVPLEEFIKSTLTLQYEAPLHKEALCALAIAARTDAYMKIQEGKASTRPWEIKAREAGYYGCGVMNQKTGVEEAVNGTRYMVLEGTQRFNPLSSVKAEELASQGHDAKKILQSVNPGRQLGITINPKEIARK